MDIVQKTIPHIFRNKYLRESGSSYAIGSNTNTASFKGDYLPAKQDEKGNFVVDLSEVLFNGKILASGEICSFHSGETIEESENTVTIIDNLESSETNAALSANQGKVLKEMIDNVIEDYSNYDYNEYLTTLKVGTTEYVVDNNTITLPAYPTISSLGAVTLSTSQTISGLKTFSNKLLVNNHLLSKSLFNSNSISTTKSLSSFRVGSGTDTTSGYGTYIWSYGNGRGFILLGSGSTGSTFSLNLQPFGGNVGINIGNNDNAQYPLDILGDSRTRGTARGYALKSSHICLECDSEGTFGSRNNEINNYSGTLWLQYNTNLNLGLCVGGGTTTVYGGLIAREPIVLNAIEKAPIITENSILCLNLCADLLDGYHANEFALKEHSHSNYVQTSTLNTHINDTTKHITSAERTNWNNKFNSSGGLVKGNITLSYLNIEYNPQLRAESLSNGFTYNLIGIDKTTATNDIYIGGNNGEFTADYAIETFSNNFIINSDLLVKGNIYATGEINAYSPTITTNSDTFNINGDLNVKGGINCKLLQDKIDDLLAQITELKQLINGTTNN